jgi:hypothetical protein
VLFGIGWFAGRAWLDSYLRGPEFRRFIAERIGDTLRADTEVAPLAFNGLDVYTEGVKAQGFEEAAFASARVDNARMKFSLRRLLRKGLASGGFARGASHGEARRNPSNGPAEASDSNTAPAPERAGLVAESL